MFALSQTAQGVFRGTERQSSMRFEVTTRYNRQDMWAILRLQRLLNPKPPGGLLQQRSLYAFFCALLVLIVAREDLIYPLPWAFFAALVLMGCWSLPAAEGVRIWAASFLLWFSYRGKGQTLRFVFRQDHYEAEDASKTNQFPYKDLALLAEDRHRFYLVPSDGGCQVLKKKDFTVGDPAGFAAFLQKENEDMEYRLLDDAPN